MIKDLKLSCGATIEAVEGPVFYSFHVKLNPLRGVKLFEDEDGRAVALEVLVSYEDIMRIAEWLLKQRRVSHHD